ncbi:MAG: tetratricopeptide repeat protein [Promethearchaeota archaeon]
MWERYKPIKRVFVNRESYIDWMNDALSRCHEESVVLHLKGLGGIGKTSLFEHWKGMVQNTILLDCSRETTLFDRLDGLARTSAWLGIRLPRFDLLWTLRLRFVKGLQPTEEPGRSWAFDLAKALPFVGSMVNISKAIQVIGAKLRPQVQRRFGAVADWLQTRLGKNYVEKVLELLWKDPHQAEFLFVDALLEDLNGRKQQHQPLLVLLDHFETIDTEQHHWQYNDQKISEAELWYIFLSNLTNAVGVTASRRGLPPSLKAVVAVEEVELTELDEAGSRDLLTQRGVSPELHTQIVSISGGNPFILSAICDLAECCSLTGADVESLRADTLEQVRLKTWRRLLSLAEGLLEFVDRAGLIPLFDQKILEVAAPSLRTDHWIRLTKLSFVQDRGDGYWELHALARDLVLAELGDQLPKLANEVANRLEEASAEMSDYRLMGLALTVRELADPETAYAQAKDTVNNLTLHDRDLDALALVQFIRFTSEEGQAMNSRLRAVIHLAFGRVVEAESDFRQCLQLYRKLVSQQPDVYLPEIVWPLTNLSFLLTNMGRSAEAVAALREAVHVSEELVEKTSSEAAREALAYSLRHFGNFLTRTGQFSDAITVYKRAMQIYEALPSSTLTVVSPLDIQLSLARISLLSSKPDEAEELYYEALARFNELKGQPNIEQGGGMLCLAGLTLLFLLTSRVEDAEETGREVIRLGKALAKETPHAYKVALAHSFNLYGVLHRRTSQLAGAELELQEALSIYRDLAENTPDVYIQWVAQALNNQAILLRQTDRIERAEAVYHEALELYRQLVDKSPDLYRRHLAATLTSYSVLLRQSGRLSEAESVLREALAIRRRLTSKEPEFSLLGVARSLNNLGVVLAAAKRLSEATTAFQETLRLYKILAAKAPSLHLGGLTSILNNMGILHRQRGQLIESEQAYQEALEYLEDLVQKAPEFFKPKLTQVLGNFLLLCKDRRKPAQEIVELQNRLESIGVTKPPDKEEWSECEEDLFWIF